MKKEEERKRETGERETKEERVLSGSERLGEAKRVYLVDGKRERGKGGNGMERGYAKDKDNKWWVH